MSQMLSVDTTFDANKVISTIVRSGGDWELAAERLSMEPEELIAYLPNLPHELLVNAMKTAITIQAFRTWTETRKVVVGTMDELPPSARARFLIDILDRLNALLGSGPAVQSNNNFQFNIGGNPRDVLAERLIAFDANREAN